MKVFLDYLMIVFMICIPILLFIIAGILAFNNKNGWGWFLFVGLLILGFTDFSIHAGEDEKCIQNSSLNNNIHKNVENLEND